MQNKSKLIIINAIYIQKTYNNLIIKSYRILYIFFKFATDGSSRKISNYWWRSKQRQFQ